MGRFVEGEDRGQQTMLPACLEDYIAEDNPARVVDAFIDQLDHSALGLGRVQPAATGRPAYHPGTLLKIYLYDYLAFSHGHGLDRLLPPAGYRSAGRRRGLQHAHCEHARDQLHGVAVG